jgi:EpsI family protein
MTRQLRVRLLIVLTILLAARLAAGARTPVITPLRESLSAFPLQLEQWHGRNGRSFDAETLRVLGADDYVNRIYEHATHGVVGLYVGYYGAQTQGDAIHSPQNCLPGSGWVPVSHTRPTLQTPDGDFAVNRYIVEKRGDRQLVLYWFEGRGRRVASEYLNKAYLLRDALRLGRTNGALVRIIAPVADGDESSDASAQAFARALAPQLRRWLP